MEDLILAIEEWKSWGCEIVIGVDANEDVSANTPTSFRNRLREAGLNEAIQQRHRGQPPATQIERTTDIGSSSPQGSLSTQRDTLSSTPTSTPTTAPFGLTLTSRQHLGVSLHNVPIPDDASRSTIARPVAVTSSWRKRGTYSTTSQRDSDRWCNS